MLSESKLLVPYRRVSSEDQAETGSSLKAQTEKIQAFAERLGHRLTPFEDDGGESAKSLKRPGIQRCLAMLRSKAVDGIVVANVDRLTRHVGDLVGIVEGHFIEPGGAVLLSASEPVETRTSVGRLQLYILGVVSQYQRESGVERTFGVMQFKRGRKERTGNIPFGKVVDASDPRRSKGDRPIALVESTVDREVEAIILQLRGLGMSMQRIAESLNARNIPAKRGVTRRSTGQWAKSSVHAILKRAKNEPAIEVDLEDFRGVARGSAEESGGSEVSELPGITLAEAEGGESDREKERGSAAEPGRGEAAEVDQEWLDREDG